MAPRVHRAEPRGPLSDSTAEIEDIKVGVRIVGRNPLPQQARNDTLT